MKFSQLVNVYKDLEATQSSLEMTSILSDFFQEAETETLEILSIFVMGRPFPAWKNLDIGISSKLMIKALNKATGIPESEIKQKWKDTGDLGDSAYQLVKKKSQQTLFSKELTVESVSNKLEKISKMEGSGSQENKISHIAELIGSADPDEAKYIVRIILGEMRIGVGEGIVRDAIAEAFELEQEVVQSAYDLTNDFGVVARTAKEEGSEGLKDLDMEFFRPIKVMLAQKVESMEEGFEEVGNQSGYCALDFKYDGMRAQIHKKGDKVKVFTRRLEDVTDQFPDIVKTVKEGIEAENCIIDSEIIAFDPEDGSLVPFQNLSKRIKRKYDIDQIKKQIPVKLHPFDLIYLEDQAWINRPYKERWKKIKDLVNEEDKIRLADHLETDSKEEARKFYQKALNADQEGVMLKNLEARYKPGSRVGYMVKLKPVKESFDLVITEADWGEGRRKGWLASFTLSCRDKETNELKTIGKMATGLTDEQFKEMTERLEDLIISEEGRHVKLKPEVVVEVVYEEIQESPTYSSGFALRFPRLYRIRDDLSPDNVDSLEKVKKVYKS